MNLYEAKETLRIAARTVGGDHGEPPCEAIATYVPAERDTFAIVCSCGKRWELGGKEAHEMQPLVDVPAACRKLVAPDQPIGKLGDRDLFCWDAQLRAAARDHYGVTSDIEVERLAFAALAKALPRLPEKR